MPSNKKLDTIDRHAKRYSASRGRLSRRYAAFKRKLELLQAQHLPKIKAALDEAATVKSQLEVAITAAPELFKEPRTLVLHGVRVGFMDGKPSVKLPRGKKVQKVVDQIRAQFTPEEIATLTLISRVSVDVPNSEALLLHLSKGGAAIAGVEYTAAGDRVFIKPADHALDKVITTLLKEGLQKGTAAGEVEEPEAEDEAA